MVLPVDLSQHPGSGYLVVTHPRTTTFKQQKVVIDSFQNMWRREAVFFAGKREC